MADDDPLPLPERPPPPPTWRDVVDRVVAPERAQVVRVAGAAVVLAVLAAVAWWALRPPPAPDVAASLPMAGAGGPGGTGDAGGMGEAPPASPTTSTDPEPTELVVHAAGAVAAPGVHQVPAGARIADLLAAAGGPAPDADLDRVNLAAPLADGARVWFPRLGEGPPPDVVADPVAGGAAGPDGGAGSEPAPIDLNAATAEELDTLPGVGPAIAAAIVEHRDRNGPFRSVDELLDVPGIGPAKLEDLRDRVTV